MGRYRIVSKASSTSNNRFISECYAEVFWVEKWMQVRRGLFKTRLEMQWVPVEYRLSVRSAKNFIEELQCPREPVEEKVVWCSDEH